MSAETVGAVWIILGRGKRRRSGWNPARKRARGWRGAAGASGESRSSTGAGIGVERAWIRRPAREIAAARRLKKRARKACSVGGSGRATGAPVEHDVGLRPVDGVVNPAAGLLHAKTAPLSLRRGRDRESQNPAGDARERARGGVRGTGRASRRSLENSTSGAARVSKSRAGGMRAVAGDRAPRVDRTGDVARDAPRREGDPWEGAWRCRGGGRRA